MERDPETELQGDRFAMGTTHAKAYGVFCVANNALVVHNDIR